MSHKIENIQIVTTHKTNKPSKDLRLTMSMYKVNNPKAVKLAKDFHEKVLTYENKLLKRKRNVTLIENLVELYKQGIEYYSISDPFKATYYKEKLQDLFFDKNVIETLNNVSARSEIHEKNHAMFNSIVQSNKLKKNLTYQLKEYLETFKREDEWETVEEENSFIREIIAKMNKRAENGKIIVENELVKQHKSLQKKLKKGEFRSDIKSATRMYFSPDRSRSLFRKQQKDRIDIRNSEPPRPPNIVLYTDADIPGNTTSKEVFKLSKLKRRLSLRSNGDVLKPFFEDFYSKILAHSEAHLCHITEKIMSNFQEKLEAYKSYTEAIKETELENLDDASSPYRDFYYQSLKLIINSITLDFDGEIQQLNSKNYKSKKEYLNKIKQETKSEFLKSPENEVFSTKERLFNQIISHVQV